MTSVWEKTYHVGDAYPPLLARFSYDRDSGLDVATDFTVGLTYKMTTWDVGTGLKALDAVAASFVSSVGNVLTLRHDWLASGPLELATVGRFLVRFSTVVATKPVWLPTSGRDLFVVVLPLVA